ncbi:MAG: transcription antitermination factor NusB [Clostridia bacterium]|nr:transcription antitermination factor NusB [Clostridia bacterium]
MKRNEERKTVFYLVFEKCFRDESCEEILSIAQEVSEFKITDYISSTFCGVINNLSEIDGIISPCLSNWSINRLPKTTLSILRLAVFEMKFNDEIPVSVAIDQAVEIAKEYSDEKDAVYINGVLGTIARECDK